MIQKAAQTETDIHPLMQNRWSPRAFAADQAIDNNKINAMLEAARWAPSCMNEQPWRFVVCIKQQDEAAWQQLLDCLSEKNRQWAQHAPLLILSVASDNFAGNGKANRWAAYDTGAACISLVLQATALDLVCHQIGGFDADLCRQVFDLPVDCTPMSVIAVGYQAEAEQLNEEMQQKERADRSRATLSERFFRGRWRRD